MMTLVKANNRQHPRQKVNHDLSATLTIRGRTYDGAVLDYSLHGVGLRVEKAAAKRAESERGEHDIQVSLKDTSFSGKIRHSRLDGDDVVFGVNLSEMKEEDEPFFSSEDAGWDLIEDAETLQNIYSDLAYKGPEAPVDMRQIKGMGTILAQKVREDDVMVFELFEMRRGMFEAGRASFRFEMFQTCHAFEANVIAVTHKTVEVELPKKVARLLRRETFRVRNGENGKFLKVKLHSRILGTPPEQIEVYDFSEHGLAILDSTGWAYAPAGVPFDSIEITTSDGKVIRGTGTIRGYRWLTKESVYSVGIAFTTASVEDRNLWHNVILEARYPSLSFFYNQSDHGGIWGLFERSGYLDLKPREAFTHVFDITKSTWENLSRAGTQYSKRAVIKRNEVVVGHLQMDRIYPETWCAHHLAIDPQHSKVVGKELYSVTADVLSAEGARYIFSLTEKAKPWNQRNYYDFVRNYRFPEHNELKTFQVYEVDTKKSWNLRVSRDFEIRIANKFDRKRISRYFELHASELERNACGLTEKHLDLSKFNEQLVPYGLTRGREFVVAVKNNSLLGFARIELGTLGVNIFGLLDMLYVHLTNEAGNVATEIYETLVDAGLKRFRELEKTDVIVALDDDRSSYYSESGLFFIWDGVRWLSRCETARRYHAYTQMLYGHLIMRREQIRKHREKN